MIVFKSAAVAAGVLTALTLAGCSGSSATPAAAGADSSVAAAPVATSVDPAEQARAEVKSVYDDYQQAMNTALVTGDYAAKEIDAITVDPFRSQIHDSGKALKKAGLIGKGAFTWTVQDITVRMEQKPPTATVNGCIDVSKMTILSVQTGKALPMDPTKNVTYVATNEAKLVDGKWVIVSQNDQYTKKC